ncbi:hypothetical protein SANTM175S_09629 [Streptomyces antimycoticus]
MPGRPGAHLPGALPVETLAQQVDADQHVELTGAQLAQQLDPAQGVHIAVQIAHLDAELEHVVGQVLGHLLGEGGDQDALVLLGAGADLMDEIVDLALGRLDDDLGVDQAGRADDLLHEAIAPGELERARGRGEIDRLADALQELLPLQRAVVERGGKPEAVLDQGPAPEASPSYIAPICGTVTCDSSMTRRKSSGK